VVLAQTVFFHVKLFCNCSELFILKDYGLEVKSVLKDYMLTPDVLAG
jgi:hypothetical protein